MPMVHQRREGRTDDFYDSNTALALRASRGKKCNPGFNFAITSVNVDTDFNQFFREMHVVVPRYFCRKSSVRPSVNELYSVLSSMDSVFVKLSLAS